MNEVKTLKNETSDLLNGGPLKEAYMIEFLTPFLIKYG